MNTPFTSSSPMSIVRVALPLILLDVLYKKETFRLDELTLRNGVSIVLSPELLVGGLV